MVDVTLYCYVLAWVILFVCWVLLVLFPYGHFPDQFFLKVLKVIVKVGLIV